MATRKTTKKSAAVAPVLDYKRSEPVAACDTGLVPTGAHEYRDTNGLLDVVRFAIAKNEPALILGETGTGKTSAIRAMCAALGLPYRRVNLNGGTTADELVGKILIKDGTTYWNDGVLVDAMKRGHVIVFDEINAAQPDVLFVLQSLLDDDRMLVVDDGNGTIIRPHADFRFFATANPSDQGGYAGTRDLNKALMSRFTAVHFAEYADKKTEAALLIERTGDARIKKWAGKLCELAAQNRKEYAKQDIDDVISTRDLLATARLASAFAADAKEIDAEHIRRAIRLGISNKMTREGRDGLETWVMAEVGDDNGIPADPHAPVRFKNKAELLAWCKKHQGNDKAVLVFDRTVLDSGATFNGEVQLRKVEGDRVYTSSGFFAADTIELAAFSGQIKA